ncbi:hypothetical protein T439DRAFT_322675 [Meredithblackwellia eburnea MCA 4105]
MDPFEVRMAFISLVSKLTSSLASIQRVSAFAFKHGPKCGDDIWDCLIEECATSNLNAKINLLYFLDALLDNDPKLGAGPSQQQPYRDLVRKDLRSIVDQVVPQTREGILNYMSTIQVLRSWKTRRLLDAELLDSILQDLEARRELLHNAKPGSDSTSKFSRNDIIRRIEDDRERHKRLRERIWVLPVPSALFSTNNSSSHTQASTSNSTRTSPSSPASPSEYSGFRTNAARKINQSLASGVPAAPSNLAAVISNKGPELAIEIEFDQLWETSEEERLATLSATSHNGRGRPSKRRKTEIGVNGGGSEEDENGDSTADGDDLVDKSEQQEPLWPLSAEDRSAMRRERERCFGKGPS